MLNGRLCIAFAQEQIRASHGIQKRQGISVVGIGKRRILPEQMANLCFGLLGDFDVFPLEPGSQLDLGSRNPRRPSLDAIPCPAPAPAQGEASQDKHPPTDHRLDFLGKRMG